MEPLTVLDLALEGFRFRLLSLFFAEWSLPDGFTLYQVLSTHEGEAAAPPDWFLTRPTLEPGQPTVRTWQQLLRYYSLTTGQWLPAPDPSADLTAEPAPELL